jgi:hypothetical protein
VTELQSPAAVVCHDAGAANLVLAWLETGHWPGARALMAGPAGRLAAASKVRIGLCASLDEALDGAASLLTGTGWASSLEHDARAMARARGIRSVAVLDHWVNYAERFERGGHTVLPDELWVTDEYALREARRCFPGVGIRTQRNLYLEKLVEAIGPCGNGPDVLYLLEPTRSDWGRGTPGEFQALDYFIGHMGRLGLAPGTPVRLRLHPQEPTGKYDAWLDAHPGTAVLDGSADLASAMRPASWVAGCETAALVAGLASGRRAVCTLPPWAPPCRLPHEGLVHLKLAVPGPP